MAEFLKICEVGPRDGLQNEAAAVATADKQKLLDALLAAGLKYIELTSFVSAKAVPQMADAEQMMPYARSAYPEAHFNALIINEKGYERALQAGAQGVGVVVVVSETLSQRNSRMSVAESLAACKAIVTRARNDGVFARVYLAVAWVCPFEGPTPPEKVLACADAVWEMGVDELALADTIGHAQPLEVGRLVEACGKRYDMSKLAVHLHDTQALGLANAAAAISAGVRIVDASVGGLGGCPFAPGSLGNLATEDVVFMAHKMGFATGVAMNRLWEAVRCAEPLVGRRVGGRIREWWEKNAGKS
ncbi:MAG: hydroxymethylglutaryl-CoA lyase [Chloroflexi bacterium]|nr:hydroxymethylglutaryl-CoA lyase [Chloroflexota bacterium]